MRTLTLSLALASALVVGAVPARAADPVQPVAEPPARTYQILGKMWCVGDVPAPVACDVHLLRPAEKQVLAGKAEGQSIFGAWIRELRETLARKDGQQASN